MMIHRFKVFESIDRLLSFTRDVYEFDINTMNTYVYKKNPSTELINFLVDMDNFLHEYKDNDQLKVILSDVNDDSLSFSYKISLGELNSADMLLESSRIISNISYIYDICSKYSKPNIELYTSDDISYLKLKFFIKI